MNNHAVEQEFVLNILWFIRGAMRVGAGPTIVRQAVEREFPRLSPAEVDELMAGGRTFARPQA